MPTLCKNSEPDHVVKKHSFFPPSNKNNQVLELFGFEDMPQIATDVVFGYDLIISQCNFHKIKKT